MKNKTINTRVAATIEGILVEISESIIIDSNTTEDIITSMKKNSVTSNMNAMQSVLTEIKG
jgi:hypothetical protein